MTIITCRAGVMACDSCWNEEKVVTTLQNKIVRLPHGAIVGGAGEFDDREILRLLSLAKTDKLLPSRQELLSLRLDYLGLVLYPNGKLFKVCASNLLPEAEGADFGVWEVTGFPYAAVGSGSIVALGAMAQGATAVQAVRIACQHDIFCRPPIHSMSIFDPKQKAKKNGK